MASRFGGDPVARRHRAGAAGRCSRRRRSSWRRVGQPLRFRDVFADWIAANILNRDEGPYGNPGRAIDIRIDNELHAGDAVDGNAHQFGTDYYAMPGLDGGEYVLRFRGSRTVPVLPPSALAEGPVLWGNAQDEIDTTLTYERRSHRRARTPRSRFRTWYRNRALVRLGLRLGLDRRRRDVAGAGGRQTTADDPAQAGVRPRLLRHQR